VKDVQLLAYFSCTLPSLTGVYGCGDNEGGVKVQFNLEAKRAGSPRVVKSSEDCCCVCQSSVDICFNISIARYYTFQVGESLYIFYVPLCNGYIGCGNERWVFPWPSFFPTYIQSNLCTLFLELGSHWHTFSSSATIAMSSAKSKSVKRFRFCQTRK